MDREKTRREDPGHLNFDFCSPVEGKKLKRQSAPLCGGEKKEKERILKSLSSAYPAESTLLAAASTNHKPLFFTDKKKVTRI